MTKREQILSAILTKLKTVAGVNPSNVERSRVIRVGDDRMPFINLAPVSDSRNEAVLTDLDSVLEINVSLSVAGDVPDSVADPIVESIQNRLLQDRSLGLDFVIDIRPGNVSFDFDEGNRPECEIGMQFLIQYRETIQF